MDIAILHLDDNPDEALMVRRNLQSNLPGSRLTWVSSKPAFLKALSGAHFDVILSDYRMPDWKGSQVLEFVLDRYPRIPVIMLTGELGEERAIEMLRQGATDYVLKKNLPRLAPAIERAVREAADTEIRRQALERLRESEQYYRILFENGPLPKWIFDRETLEILDVNPTAVDTFGYSREEFLSIRVLSLWPEKDRPEFRAHLKRLHSSRRETMHANYQKKDGTLLVAAIHWSEMDYKGRDVCLAVISDVTELVALRDQLARELADMNRLHELCRRLLEGGDTESRLKDVLLASMKLVGAQKGNVQLLDEAANALSIRAHVGLGLEYLEHFRAVPAGHGSVCGQALERRERIVAENVFEEGRFGLLREPFRREGLSACISTPLLGRDGVPFGMLSVLFAQPHKPREYELRLLDLYVHQAERVLEFLEAT